MYEESLNTISLKEVHDLIDLYKYASIEGEKVEFSVKKTNDNKRVITIEIQNGHPRDKDTFVFDDGDYFDDKIYPELLSYFTCDDPLLKWDVKESEHVEDLFVGINETQSGNALYLETSKEDYFDNLDKKMEEVKENTTYKKTPLINEDKIWDEIILYANGRRIMQDFYKGSNFTQSELEQIYSLIVYLSENAKSINYGKSKKAKENNEKFLNNFFNRPIEELKEIGLQEELINKIVSNHIISKLAVLLGVEKRIRTRLDLSNEEIRNKIEFATSELDKVDFFDLKNASKDQFKNKEFVSSKPKAIQKLVSIVESEKYSEYCEEIYGYLERKNSDSKKIVQSSIDLDSVVFTNHVEGKEEKKEEIKPEITEDALDRLLKEFSDIMLEQEAKENGKKEEKENNNLFEVIEQKNNEKKDKLDLYDLYDAYEKALSYSTANSPANIKVIFEKGNKEEASVIISNKINYQDIIILQKPYSIDELNNQVMEALSKMFLEDNLIQYNIKLNTAGTNDAGLLLIGDDHKTFKIVNAPEEFVDLHKRKIDEIINNNNEIKK